MAYGMDRATDGITGIPYSHSAYLITHPTDAFFKVGVAHIASAEIRHYVMAGCQLSQLLFLSRANAHTLQSAILRTVASQFRSIDSTHPILGQDGLNGHNTSWHTNGGLYDLPAHAIALHIQHMNGLTELPYDVIRTTMGLPRLRWQDWRIGPEPSDYREPSFPARHFSRSDHNAAHM
jgi:hypothetical protein